MVNGILKFVKTISANVKLNINHFDDSGTARCLHACTQDADGSDGCVIVPGCTVP